MLSVFLYQWENLPYVCVTDRTASVAVFQLTRLSSLPDSKESLHWEENTPQSTREGEGCHLGSSRTDRTPSYAAGPRITCACRDRHMKGTMLPELRARWYIDTFNRISTCTHLFSASLGCFLLCDSLLNDQTLFGVHILHVFTYTSSGDYASVLI